MRNFHRGYKNDSSSSFGRGDRRSDRDNRYQPNETYKRPADKGFNRSFADRTAKPRRDYDNELPRSSYNQDRRETHVGNRPYRGGNRSFQDRSFRNDKPERSFRNHTPPRSRDRESHPDTRFNRSSDIRSRPRPPSPGNFRSRNEFQPTTVRPRTSRGGGAIRRGIGSTGPRILRRNDLRSSLITKRTAPINRSKEYIKKIKQARLKLGEGHSKHKANDEPQTPPKESQKDPKNDDDEDFLDVANDVIFDEDENILAKNATIKTEENGNTSRDKEEDETIVEKSRSVENLNTSGASEERARKARSTKSSSEEKENSSSSVLDLNCVHCFTKCSSVQDFRYHLTRRSHLMAMKKVSIKVRLTLNRLRKVQRDRQLEIEARLKNVEKIPSKYCQICKLYFRQSKIEHRDSEDHKKIRNFLKPYCKVCHLQLLSAMKFEIHKCTINHLKTKANKHETAEDVDMQDLDFAEFKTVDSIGDVDGEEESDIDDEEFDSKDTEAVGQEFVNKIEVNYCSLCREYLLRTSKDEKIISDHCKSKKHLKWYYQSKKKDEKLSALKAKNEEAMEVASKDDTSVQETDKISKSQTASDKDSKTVNKDEETSAATVSQKDVSITDNDDGDDSEENSKKFKRYFEVANNVENDR